MHDDSNDDHHHECDVEDNHEYDPSEQRELTRWDICHIVHWAEMRIMKLKLD